ncbi:MAG: hypothetical protein ACXABY_20185 [Candidatus Thorarchaeota archaeon]|jgi:hypothetical protein
MSDRLEEMTLIDRLEATRDQTQNANVEETITMAINEIERLRGYLVALETAIFKHENEIIISRPVDSESWYIYNATFKVLGRGVTFYEAIEALKGGELEPEEA